ncbi:MAG TPA: hypothetical protein VKR06_06510 [Ktedonosporobacter sp.]|nr:hypothetical protein [Ktedonosporobacter sp.]
MAIKTFPDIDAPPLKTAPQRSDGWFRRLQRRIKLAFAGDNEHLLVANKTVLSWRIYHNYHLLGIIDPDEQHTFQLTKHGSLNVRPATEEDGVDYLMLPLNERINRVQIYRRQLGKEVEVYDMRVA